VWNRRRLGAVDAVDAKRLGLVSQRGGKSLPVGVQEAGQILGHEPERLDDWTTAGSRVSTTHREATRRNSAQPSGQSAQ